MGQGPFEIERRYLVRMDPALWACLGEGRRFVQGYVKTGDPSVRIRTGEARGPVLTLKSGNGVRRREVETVVPEDVADAIPAPPNGVEIVREVTGDNSMTNSALARMAEEQRAPFVHRLYGGGAPC